MNKKEILEFIKNFRTMQLSTIDEYGYPACRTVFNALCKGCEPHLVKFFDENDNLYFITNTKSEKVVQIRNNAKASLYFSDNENYKTLLLSGYVKIVDNEKIKKALWNDGWDVYFEGGVRGLQFGVLEFIVEKYKLFCNLKTEEKDIKW